MQRKNRDIVIFNLSAIDLFCSGMGAVMVLMVLLMPYYTRPKPQEAKPVEPVVVTPPPPAPPMPPSPDEGVRLSALELVIVLDTTGSMGSSLEALRRRFSDIASVLSRLSKRNSMGVVAYRDHGKEEYLTRQFPLVPIGPGGEGVPKIRAFLDSLKAGGGGDDPEAVADALMVATNASEMGWSNGAIFKGKQIVLIIADAPGHDGKAAVASGIATEWVAKAKERAVHCATNEKLAANISYFTPLAKSGRGKVLSMSDDMLLLILDALALDTGKDDK